MSPHWEANNILMISWDSVSDYSASAFTLSTCLIYAHLPNYSRSHRNASKRYHGHHFVGEETEAQGGKLTYPQSQG